MKLFFWGDSTKCLSQRIVWLVYHNSETQKMETYFIIFVLQVQLKRGTGTRTREDGRGKNFDSTATQMIRSRTERLERVVFFY